MVFSSHLDGLPSLCRELSSYAHSSLFLLFVYNVTHFGCLAFGHREIRTWSRFPKQGSSQWGITLLNLEGTIHLNLEVSHNDLTTKRSAADQMAMLLNFCKVFQTIHQKVESERFNFSLIIKGEQPSPTRQFTHPCPKSPTYLIMAISHLPGNQSKVVVVAR